MKEISRVSYKILFLILAPTLVIAPNSFLDPINWPKQIIFVLVIPIILFELYIHFSSIITKKLLVPFILSASLLLIAAVLNYESLTTTLWGTWGRNNGLITSLLLIFIAFVVSILIRIDSFGTYLVKAISLCYIPATIYGLSQFIGFEPLDWSVKDQVFSVFGNTNFASTIFSLSALASLIVFFRLDTTSKFRLIYLAQGIGSIIVMLGTNSLQGPVALALGLGIWGYYGLKRKWGNYSRIFLGLGVSAFSFLLLSFFGFGPMGSLLYQYTLKLRSLYWLAGLKIGSTSPIYGVGVDSYGDFYRQNRSQETIELTSIDLTVSNAHNSPIQIFATLGVIGLIAYFVVMAPALLFAIKSVLKPSKELKTHEFAIVSLFLAAFSVSLISIDNISVAIPTWALSGACYGLYFQTKSAELIPLNQIVKLRKLSYGKSSFVRLDAMRPILLTSMTLLLFATTWYSSLVDREIVKYFREPYSSLSQAEKDRFVSEIFSLASNHPFQQSTQVNYLFDLIVRDPNYNIIAASVGNIGLAKFPLDYGTLDRVALIQERLGRWDEALKIRNTQLEIDPRHPRVRAYLAQDLIKIGKTSEAKYNIELATKWALAFSDQGTLKYLEELQELLK